MCIRDRFIIDVKRESIAVTEASKMGIPIVGIVDSNSNPEGIDYVVPGNDDSIRSIALFTEAVADACLKGSEAATGLKQDEPQSGPAIVRKVETNETTEEPPQKDTEVSGSISNEESADETQEIQEPTEDTPESKTSDEDDKETKDKE